MVDAMTFGELMLSLMDEQGISLRGLARKVYSNHGYLSKLSRNERDPSPEFAKKLDEALKADGKLFALAPVKTKKETKTRDTEPLLQALVEAITSDSTTNTMKDLLRRTLLQGGLAAIAPNLLGTEASTFPESRLFAPPTHSWGAAIYHAVLNPVEAARGAGKILENRKAQREITPTSVHQSTAQAIQVSLASDYKQLADSLPRLIGQLELATIQSFAVSEASTQQLYSDVYAVAAWTLIKADSPIAAWVAANRSIQAAELISDPLRAAAATRCMAEVYMRAGRLEEASRTALLAATYLDTAPRTAPRSTVLCLRGAAFLSAGAAAARRGDSWEAQTALKAATACASELAHDRTDLGTMFGPTNVAIHKVAISIELGNAREALRYASEVKIDAMPDSLSERRARYLIDVARSYVALKQDSAAIGVLLKAEEIAPDELRHHRLTHRVIRGLLPRERQSSELRALAARCELED